MAGKVTFKEGYEEWLKENWDKYTYPELRIEFGRLFRPDRPVSTSTMGHVCRRLGLRKQANRPRYDKESMEWLKEHYDEGTAETIAKIMSEKFGRYVSADHLRDLLRRHFGEVLHKSPKWIQSSWVKAGEHSHTGQAKPIGSEIEQAGYVWIKVKDDVRPSNCDRSRTDNWVQKHVWLYEQHYGTKVPKTHCVMFLDGNTKNFSVQNLYMVSRSVASSCANTKWWRNNNDTDLRITIIKYFEMLEASKLKHKCR